MRVLHATSELYPFAKTGGLADVLAALPPAQVVDARVDARIVLPGYRTIMDGLSDARAILGDPDLYQGGPARLLSAKLVGVAVRVYVLDAPGLYLRGGGPYGDGHGRDYADNHLRFGALAWAAARLARGADPVWQPDVLHAHDWQSGLAPAYLALDGAGPRPATVQTIHNIQYPGSFPPEVLASLGLPASCFHMHGVEFYGALSFLKAGLYYADHITTVSPQYAREITSEPHGGGFGGLLADRADRLTGILNGIDTRIWDPRSDQRLPARYDARDLSGKAVCRQQLRARFQLAKMAPGPIVGVISRLIPQKGLDLLLEAAPRLFELGGQLVLLGSGDPAIEAGYRELVHRYPGQVGVEIGYDEELAHLLQAGADVIAVPSLTEPCGLTQMYALRYGSLPLVRRTGGLADTVVDATEATMEAGHANGFVFDAPTVEALAEALARAATLFKDRARWRRVQQIGMQAEHGWGKAAQQYADLYRRLRPEA